MLRVMTGRLVWRMQGSANDGIDAELSMSIEYQHVAATELNNM